MPASLKLLDPLEDFEVYCRRFTDVDLWRPYVQAACQAHGLAPCARVRVGLPGTYPAFIVEERWLVKFFGRLFDGARSFAVEQEANRLAAQDPAIPAARVLASGQLGGDGAWHWPYLIYAFVPGSSIGEVRQQLTQPDALRVARELGELARRLHALPLAGSTVFPAGWQDYLDFLARQRATCLQNQREWGTLPEPLIDQIERYLPPPEALLAPGEPPHLIHADLTGDHLLGRLEDGCWRTLALIDFGDARTGSLYYELAALQLDLLAGQRELLAAFLDVYGISREERAALPAKALATALLHQFNVLAGLPPEKRQAATLEDLAQALFGG